MHCGVRGTGRFRERRVAGETAIVGDVRFRLPCTGTPSRPAASRERDSMGPDPAAGRRTAGMCEASPLPLGHVPP